MGRTPHAPKESSMNRIKVLIADDHAIVRDGIQQLLKPLDDMEVVGVVTDGLQALEKAKNLSPDVILLDIAMPNLNGLEAIGLIKEALPESQIVILSMHANESYVQQVLKSGAMGYVLKASPSIDIVRAIRFAHKNEYFLSSKIRANVIDSYLKTKKNEPTVRGYDLLSEREQQVFRLVVQGSSTKEIADILCVSPKTIEKHRSRISNKLGVHGRLEMLKYAIKIGIVNPELWA
jgi:two-component system response regulator NreC